MQKYFKTNIQGFFHKIAKLPKLKSLNISNCNIGNVGIAYFADFIKNSNNVLQKLEILNLISNPFGNECLKDLIYIVKNLKSLKRFSIAQTQLSPNASYSIHQSLKKDNPNWIFDDNGGWFILIEKDINPDILTLKEIKDRILPILAKHEIKEVYLFGV